MPVQTESLLAAVREVALPAGGDRPAGPPGGPNARPGPALDRLLAARERPPALLALGEPTHGVEAFPRLRNELLAHLVERHGFRSVALESDCLAATAVDDHVTTGEGDLDDVLATGFSHGFGASPANRELVTWLRDHNARRDPDDQVRFHGFDAPLEMTGAAGPRASLLAAHAYLAAHLGAGRVTHDAAALDALLGDDARWTDPRALTDPSLSVGDTAEARALRLAADDLVALFEAEAPRLRAAGTRTAYERALTAARTARGLLRYHAAMASSAPGRVSSMLGLRDLMMAENLVAIARAQARRGPCLVFAHNHHLHRGQSSWELAGMELRWWSAGALAAESLGDGYAVVAADAGDVEGEPAGRAGPGSLQAVLADAASGLAPFPAFFPAEALAGALAAHPGVRARADSGPGYFPLDPAQLGDVDAVAFLTSAH